MYGKLFDSMYDGTLVEHWEALITFQQMIILCDADGVLDMTPEAISRRTSIPIEIIKKGIEILESPDSRSRTPDSEGRRIIRLDKHRDWGWYLVNHEKFKNLQAISEVRDKNRDRKRKQRQRDKEARDCHTMSHDVTGCPSMSPYKDTNTNTNTNTKSKSKPLSSKLDEIHDNAVEILNYLSKKTGTKFVPTEGTLKPIKARLKQKDFPATLQTAKQVIDKKCAEWLNNSEMKKYLKPSTLFAAKHFHTYLAQPEVKPNEKLDEYGNKLSAAERVRRANKLDDEPRDVTPNAERTKY